MGSAVRIEAGAGVATVVVDNPPVNALDEATLRALGAAAQRLAGERGTRAVVLTGAGDRAFLAGADLEEIRDSVGRRGGMDEHVAVTGPVFAAWSGLPQPVVAAVGAHAVGGGLELALVCDLVVADPRARFGLPEVTLGLIPGAGGSQRLTRRIGAGRAAELLLLGKLVDAEQAQRLGIVNEIAAEGEARSQAQALASRLAELPRVAVQAAKQAVRAAAGELEAGLAAERRLFLETAASADAGEGVSAFIERRPPVFGHR